MKNKRGLSAIIVTLILIALVLVAVGIVWAVISNVLDKSSEDISAGLTRVDLNIVDETVSDNENQVSLRVSRDVGKGDLVKIKFVLDDGSGIHLVEKSADISELGNKEFSLNKGDLGDLVKISIAPVIKTESGKESLRNIVDVYYFPGYSEEDASGEGDDVGQGDGCGDNSDCEEGFTCENSECVEGPEIIEEECTIDEDCEEGFICDNDICIEKEICEPSCEGKTCGDDGCGGTCGNCKEGSSCIEGTCSRGDPEYICDSFDTSSGLIAHYNLDKNWQDSSGFANHGTPLNGVGFSDSSFAGSGAVEFSKVQESLDIKKVGNDMLAITGTISLWVKTDKSNNWNHVFYAHPFNADKHSIIQNGNRYILERGEIRGQVYLYPENMNEWNHLVMVWERGDEISGAPGNVRGYLNGEYIGEDGFTHKGGRPAVVWLGHDPNSKKSFQGLVDELMIFNRALSTEEVYELYQEGLCL